MKPMSMTMSRSNPHPTFHSCLQNDIMMVLSIVSTIIYGILFARFCIVEHGTTISSFLCHIVTLAPPIETGLSFSTGTFLSNYDVIKRKLLCSLTGSTIWKQAKRTPDIIVENTSIKSSFCKKLTYILLWASLSWAWWKMSQNSSLLARQY